MGNVDIDSLMPEIETGDAPPELPDAKLNVEPPADKEPQQREKDGKFAGDGKKEPEAKKEPAKEEAPKPEAKPEHTVPVRTLVEERKAWLAERKALEERLAKLENPPKPPEAPPEDPKAYADFKVKAALAEMEGTKKQVEELKQTTVQASQQTEEMRFGQHLQAAEQAFVAQNPDYYEALNHVRTMRANQLKLLAPDITDAQIAQQIVREEIGLAMNLARSGRNPIETVYQMAKAYGHQPKVQPEELPKVPGQKKLPPDQTLGSGAGGAVDTDDQEQRDPFEDAFKELYGKRKAS